jgi:hypothetical protein
MDIQVHKKTEMLVQLQKERIKVLPQLFKFAEELYGHSCCWVWMNENSNTCFHLFGQVHFVDYILLL